MESYHCPVQNPPMALRLETKPKSPQWPVGLVCSNLCCLSRLISYSSLPSAHSTPAFSWILALLPFLKHTQETPAWSLCTRCSLCLVRFSPATHGSLSHSTEVSAQMPHLIREVLSGHLSKTPREQSLRLFYALLHPQSLTQCLAHSTP